MANELTLIAVDNGFVLRGDLRAHAVTAVLTQLPVKPERCDLDLVDVTDVDSAGLALLLEWNLRFQAAGGQLVLRRVPEQCLKLAQISSIDTILGLSTEDSQDGLKYDGA